MKKLVLIASFVVGLGVGIVRIPDPPLSTQIQTILEDCRRRDPAPTYIRCFDGKKTAALISKYGVRAVMDALNNVYQASQSIADVGTISCHDAAHVVGMIAARQTQDVGKTIVACSGQCSYGCVHGALLQGLRARPQLLNGVADLCTPFLDPSVPKAYGVACQHGIGHGLADLASLDIPKGLASCDGLGDDRARMHCGRGVLMEIIDSPVLEHPPMTLPDDIVGFCGTLGGVYQESCYVNAGSREYARARDAIRAIDACYRVPLFYRDSCFSFLGQHVYFFLGGSVSDIVRFCSQTPGEGVNACMRGVLESIAYYERMNQAKALCAHFAGAAHTRCLEVFGEQLEYTHGKKRREEILNN